LKRLSSVFLIIALVLVTGSLIFFIPHRAMADVGVNKLDTVFRTAWVYDSPGDNFTNGQLGTNGGAQVSLTRSMIAKNQLLHYH
jgi:hypothetical protein